MAVLQRPDLYQNLRRFVKTGTDLAEQLNDLTLDGAPEAALCADFAEALSQIVEAVTDACVKFAESNLEE